jgi:hypothetical protein
MDQSVDEFIAHIDACIELRAAVLDEDLNANILVEDKIVSSTLSQVNGLQRHLDRARMTRLAYQDQLAVDHNSHAATSRADLHRRTPAVR